MGARRVGVNFDVSSSSKPRPKAKPEQRKVAAALIAQGASSAEAARSIHVSLRTLERWRATEGFQAMITQAERAIEQAAYEVERKRYVRHGKAIGAAEPVHPRDKRLGPDARPELAEPAVPLPEAARRARPTAPDVELEISDRAAHELWLLDKDLNSGRITQAEYDVERASIVTGNRRDGRPRQIGRILGIPTGASRLYDATRNQNDAYADAFEGQYASGPDSGGTYQLREVWLPQDAA